MSSRLASLLVQDGVIAANRLAEVFQRQVIYGGTVDTLLLEMGLIDEAVLLDYLERASDLPVLDEWPTADAGQLQKHMPLALAERYGAAPVAFTGSTLQVVITDPPEARQIERLKIVVSLPLDLRIVPEYRFHLALERAYGVPLPSRFALLWAQVRPQHETAAARRLARLQGPPTEEMAPAPAGSGAPAPRTTLTFPRGAVDPRDVGPGGEMVMAPSSTPRSMPAPELTWSYVAPAEDEYLPDGTVEEPLAGDATVRQEDPPQMAGTPATEAPAARSNVMIVRPSSPSASLDLEDGAHLLEQASTRDEVFEILCRIAISRFELVAVLSVQKDGVVARMALSTIWLERGTLSEIVLSVAGSPALQAAVDGRSPYLGKLGTDPEMAEFLDRLGRQPPLWGVLVPIILRGRTVALLYGDAGGSLVQADRLADLHRAANEAAQALQRIILRSKSTRAPVAEAQPSSDATTRVEAVTTPLTTAETEALVDSLANERVRPEAAAPALVEAGEQALATLVARLPGPLRLMRYMLVGPMAPLSQYGPLLATVPLCGQAIVPHLLGRLRDPATEVRFYTCLCFTELHDPAAIGPLGDRLFDTDLGVHAAAAAALRRFRPSPEQQALVARLRTELFSRDPLRRRQAASAVGELRDVSSLPRLIELLQTNDEGLITSVRRALVAITKQDFAASRWRWRTWWDQNRERTPIDWLLDGLHHPSLVIQQAASDELEAILADRFGYHAHFPQAQREEAHRKWLEWFRGR